MFIAYIVVAVLLAAALTLSGSAMLTKNERLVATMTELGVPAGLFAWLAAAELGGAFGLLAGAVVAPLGIAAATGVTAYFVGAVAAHLRAGDLKGSAAPATLLAFALAALTLRITST